MSTEKEAKLKALQLTLDKLDKTYGKGAVMKMGDSASMSFVMPSEYNMQDLPTPSNNQVKLIQENSKILAVIRFGGYSSSEKIKKYADQLYLELKNNKLETRGKLLYLGYNAPWDVTNRRNEVAIELVKAE